MKKVNTSDFQKYQAQTTPDPLMINVAEAKGSYITDKNGKRYLDFVAGVSACSVGHCNDEVIEAIREQSRLYMHVMVYGEFITDPSLNLAKLLSENLPGNLNCTYFTNSGTEALEGAMKLARRFTGRQKIIAAKNAYHGSTMGALTLMGLEERKKPFEPLIPEVEFILYNSIQDIDKIDNKTSCVIVEAIQGSAGFILPEKDYLKKLKIKCKEVGALLILDEIQTGIGRTGKLFGFENFDCIPDVIVYGKGLGGGIPIGAFTSSKKIMDSLHKNPILGHITTFGGNPVITAAALQTLKIVLDSEVMTNTLQYEKFIRNKLKHHLIKEIRGLGLMLCLIMKDSETADKLVLKAKEKGLILFWLLIEKRAVRITPPLTISKKELSEGCNIILDLLDTI
jgi:acetylornithine aminotransferase|tara:strand:+ start:1236 stop:2423 length:1188 start_codon:yes stop_codon:yes gene_type:complete